MTAFAQSPLKYSMLLGGSKDDWASRVTIDAAGNIFIAGWTTSSDFPTVNAYQAFNQGGKDAFVTKIGPDGTILYSTYLGGSSDDVATDIAVDAGGNAYVVGYTKSSDFPSPSSGQRLSGPQNGFLVRLDPSGKVSLTKLLGGQGTDAINAVAIDTLGNITVAGVTNSPSFGGMALNNSQDAFVGRLSPSGSVIFITRFGGSLDDGAMAVANDHANGTIVVGYTQSSDFPVLQPVQPTAGGLGDCFIIRFDVTGKISFSTYLGGSRLDYCTGVAVTTSSVTVVGGTASTDFPVRRAFQSQNGGGTDAFITRLDASALNIAFSTYFGGSDSDTALAVAVDSDGTTYFSGQTFSTNLPLANALQSTNHGSFDVMAAKLDATGNPVFSTYLGGQNDDFGNGIVLDTEGNIYIAGATLSSDFPAAGSSAGSTQHGGSDAFLLRIDSMQTHPPNDDFESAQPINGTSGSITGSNVGATLQPGESLAPQAGRTSVWWKWTAPFDGTAVFNTTGSSFDTVIAIYQGTALNNLTLIASDNGSGGQGASLVSFAASSGSQYMIDVSGFSDASGNIVLRWNLHPAPLNIQDVNFIGLPQIAQPAVSETVHIQLQHTLQFALTGQLTLSFTPDAVVFSMDDNAIQFATGGRTITFTIPAGSVDALFSNGDPSAAFQTGTLAGAIKLTASFQGLGQDLTPSPLPSATTVVQPAPPVITDFQISAETQAGFELLVKGFATAQEVTTVTFVFTPVAGITLQNTTVTLDVADLFRSWYQNQASMFLGTTFLLSVPFSVPKGSTKELAAVSVALSNTKGNSAGVSRSFPVTN
jgi:hypothetical protein